MLSCLDLGIKSLKLSKPTCQTSSLGALSACNVSGCLATSDLHQKAFLKVPQELQNLQGLQSWQNFANAS